MSPTPSVPLVTVVIPTRNSSRTLTACLSSIRSQTHREIELIVVDNSSTDPTMEQARALADQVIVAGPERSAQRNVGARSGRGSYLLFIDSDMVLEEKVVAECVEKATRGDGVVAIVIPEDSIGDGFWTRCKALERSCYLGDESIEAARFFTRAVFSEIGGFDEDLVGAEDWDFHERVRAHGARIDRIDAMIHHDEGRLRLARLMSKKFHYGRDFFRYRSKHPGLARTQTHMIRPAFIRHRRRLLSTPLLLGGMIAMKACELAAGGAGVLFGSVRPRERCSRTT